MSNYEQSGNRYTAIFVQDPNGTLTRAPFDIVRFNVDVDPEAKRDIVPNNNQDDHTKVFEKVWIVDTLPWASKVGFNGLS